MQQPFPSTVVYRHRKENLKKCSLRGLETREDMCFYTYPRESLPVVNGYILLTLNAPPLTKEDSDRGLLILDGTWRYAEKMMQRLDPSMELVERSLPSEIKTAYPRKQEDCSDPERGLASIEAIYAAYYIMGRDVEGLLDHYYWGDDFLELNRSVL